MVGISRSVLIAAAIGIALALAPALAQTPDKVLGTEDGAYELFTPEAVAGAGLPAQTGQKGNCLSTTGSAFVWTKCGTNGGGGASLSDTVPKVESGSGAAGSSADASRGDHVHPARSLTIPGPSTTTPKVEAGSGAVGSTTVYARGDHVHPAAGGGGSFPGFGSGVPKVESGSGAVGTANSASRSDHVHPAAAGGGGNASLTWTRFARVSANSSAAVTENLTDDQFEICAEADLWAVTFVRVGTQAGIAMSATDINNSETEGAVFSETGSLLASFSIQCTGTGDSKIQKVQWKPAANIVGQIGYFYAGKVAGAGGSGSGAALSDNVPKPLGTAAAGVGTKASRDDHIHLLPTQIATNMAAISANAAKIPSAASATPKVESGSGTVGTGTAFARDDHVHPVFGAAFDLYLDGGALAWSSARVYAVRAVVQHNSVIYLNIASTQGKQASETEPGKGSSWTTYWTRFSPAGGAATPLSNNTPLVESGSGAPGTGEAASRTDHVHPARSLTIPDPATATPKVESGSGAVGTGTHYARDDHVHPVGGGGATPLSDGTPEVEKGTGSAGSATAASRGDHVHPRLFTVNSGAEPAYYGSYTKSGAEVAVSSTASTIVNAGLPSKTGNGGDFVTVKSDASDFQLSDPHAAVLSGLPAITGQGGKVLAVNSGATGVEWATAGSGGTVAWEELWTGSVSQFSRVFNFTTEQKTQCGEADFFRVRTRSKTAAALVPWQVAIFSALTNGTNVGFEGSGSTYSGDVEPLIRVLCNVSGSNIAWNAVTSLHDYAVDTLKLVGGGSSSNPTIPDPTAAGKLKHLRVNAAGAAYELADPPEGLPDYNSTVLNRFLSVTGDSSDQIAAWTELPAAPQPGTTIPEPPGIPTSGNAVRYARQDHRHSVFPARRTIYANKMSANDQTGGAFRWSAGGTDSSIPLLQAALAGGASYQLHLDLVFTNAGGMHHVARAVFPGLPSGSTLEENYRFWGRLSGGDFCYIDYGNDPENSRATYIVFCQLGDVHLSGDDRKNIQHSLYALRY